MLPEVEGSNPVAHRGTSSSRSPIGVQIAGAGIFDRREAQKGELMSATSGSSTTLKFGEPELGETAAL